MEDRYVFIGAGSRIKNRPVDDHANIDFNGEQENDTQKVINTAALGSDLSEKLAKLKQFSSDNPDIDFEELCDQIFDGGVIL